MTNIFPLLRRAVILATAPALLIASPAMAAASAGGALFDTSNISSGDESLSWTETNEEYVLVSADGQEMAAADDEDALAEARGTSRLAQVAVSSAPADFGPSRTPIAHSGPFFLVTPDTVEMIGTVDSASPRQFAQLLAAHPGVRRLVMVECPGSVDEAANHVLAREVRHAGLDTVVPRDGSVRSGAVDLFLAGVHRSADRTAEFDVHSWRDEDGREPDDFAANDPVNLEYINYYREMGLSDTAARQFYALTNSVPFESVRTLHAADMARLGLAEIAG